MKVLSHEFVLNKAIQSVQLKLMVNVLKFLKRNEIFEYFVYDFRFGTMIKRTYF